MNHERPVVLFLSICLLHADAAELEEYKNDPYR